MNVLQISVFTQNRPGHLHKVLKSFMQANINVRGLSASDTGDFGIVRIIVDRPADALQVLHAMDSAAITTEIVVVRLKDRPGELAGVIEALAANDINVGYCYSLISTYFAFSVDDIDHATAVLTAAGADIVGQEELAREDLA